MAGRPDLRVAAASTVDNSGLLAVLLEAYRVRCECVVEALAVGTAQALEILRRGDADTAITHSPADELAFVAAEPDRTRREFMANEFVIAGPRNDPAAIAGQDLASALSTIAAAQASFVSRGDQSGTHRAEQELWRELGFQPGRSAWYLSVGSGMGRALLVAEQMGAYVLTDSATLSSYVSERGLALTVLAVNEPPLVNRYSVITTADGGFQASRFALWLQSPAAAALIRGYRIVGLELFRPLP